MYIRRSKLKEAGSYSHVLDQYNPSSISSNSRRQTASSSWRYYRWSWLGSRTGCVYGRARYTWSRGRFDRARRGLPSTRRAIFRILPLGSYLRFGVLLVIELIGEYSKGDWLGLYIRIDEVASVLIVCIQDLERGLFVAFAKTVFPALVLIATQLIFGISMKMYK